MLVAGGSFFCELLVLEAEFKTAWTDITYLCYTGVACRQDLHRGWLRHFYCLDPNRSEHRQVHPLLHDIWHSLGSSVASTIHHIFMEANAAANWIATFVAKQSKD